MNTIRVNQKELVEKLIDQKVNELNASGRRGGWEVHVFPYWFKEENQTHDGKITFHQDGNFYPPDAGHVCTFPAEEFFDWGGADMHDSDIFQILESRNDARKDFKRDNNLDADFDMETLDEDMKLELEQMEREYLETSQQFTHETLSSNTKDKVECVDGEGEVIHTYKVEYV